jgi:hypothetical protein
MRALPGVCTHRNFESSFRMYCKNQDANNDRDYHIIADAVGVAWRGKVNRHAKKKPYLPE